MSHSIFVSIVSYRDPLLDTTIKSLLSMQSNNNKLTISVLDQSTINCKYKDHPSVIYKQMPPEYSNGVGWARHINSLNITDEDFYYQIDSHSVFDKNWDEYLLFDFFNAAKHYDTYKITLSNACKVFTIDAAGNVCKEHELGMGYLTVKFLSDRGFNQNKLPTPHGNFGPKPDSQIVKARHLHGGNFFTHTDFIRHVGLCPYMFLFGEEHHTTLNAFLNGYKLLHHTCVYIYHLRDTTDYISKIRVEPVISQKRIDELQNRSMSYWLSFLSSIPNDQLTEFFNYTGVDYINLQLAESAKTTLD